MRFLLGPRNIQLKTSPNKNITERMKLSILNFIYLMLKSCFYQAALPYPEPLIHFALVSGTRSGPALRCYSPANIDKELMDSARSFLRGGGLTIDVDAKVAYVSKILKW